MFDEQIIYGDKLRPCGEDRRLVRFGARLPWYRSLPLSCVERLEVAIDGQAVDPDTIKLSLYGSTHAASELPRLHSISWFINDIASIRVTSQAPLSPGEHQVDFFMRLRIPYTDEPFPQVVSAKKTMSLVEEDY